MELLAADLKKIGTAYDPSPSSAIMDAFFQNVARTTRPDELAPRALTSSEKNIAARLASGWTRKMMAQQRAITEATIKTHVESIRAKAGNSTLDGNTDDSFIHMLYHNGMAERFDEALDHAAFGLTPTQKKMARMMLEGKSNQDICKEMHILESTRKTHTNDISLNIRNALKIDLKRWKQAWKVPHLLSFVIHHPDLVRTT